MTRQRAGRILTTYVSLQTSSSKTQLHLRDTGKNTDEDIKRRVHSTDCQVKHALPRLVMHRADPHKRPQQSLHLTPRANLTQADIENQQRFQPLVVRGIRYRDSPSHQKPEHSCGEIFEDIVVSLARQPLNAEVGKDTTFPAVANGGKHCTRSKEGRGELLHR